MDPAPPVILLSGFTLGEPSHLRGYCVRDFCATIRDSFMLDKEGQRDRDRGDSLVVREWRYKVMSEGEVGT